MKDKSLHLSKEKFSPLTAVIMVVLFLYSIALVGLLVWAVFTSFKDDFSDFSENAMGLPIKWVLDNYEYVYSKYGVDVIMADGNAGVVNMPGLYLNGFLYAIGCAFTQTLVPCITAYLCAKFNYRLSKIIYTIVIVTMILPIVGALPSEISVSKAFGLYDQIWGLWLMKANFLGLYYLIFYGFFKNLPNAYSEAAKIDGAGNFRILLEIALPLVSTLFFTVLLLQFIGFWNDYSTPLIYLPNHPTIAVALIRVAGDEVRDNELVRIPMRMAGSVMMLVPVLILFLIFHKKLLGNLTMGGLKG